MYITAMCTVNNLPCINTRVLVNMTKYTEWERENSEVHSNQLTLEYRSSLWCCHIACCHVCLQYLINIIKNGWNVCMCIITRYHITLISIKVSNSLISTNQTSECKFESWQFIFPFYLAWKFIEIKISHQ